MDTSVIKKRIGISREELPVYFGSEEHFQSTINSMNEALLEMHNKFFQNKNTSPEDIIPFHCNLLIVDKLLQDPDDPEKKTIRMHVVNMGVSDDLMKSDNLPYIILEKSMKIISAMEEGFKFPGFGKLSEHARIIGIVMVSEALVKTMDEQTEELSEEKDIVTHFFDFGFAKTPFIADIIIGEDGRKTAVKNETIPGQIDFSGEYKFGGRMSKIFSQMKKAIDQLELVEKVFTN